MIRFSTRELAVVQSCAQECAATAAWPNELLVFERIASRNGDGFNSEQLEILRFCAQETAHQKEGALAVYNFLNAWNHALACFETGRRLDQVVLNEIAALIEPEANRGGTFRTCGVLFRCMPGGSNPEHIARHMAEFVDLLDAYQNGFRSDQYGRPLSSFGLYVQFEKIHPRKNGNGREGKVIFNWLEGTLAAPTFPPEPEEFN